MDSQEAPAPLGPFRSDRRIVDEAARRQDEYEFELETRLDEERTMHPDDRLDELGHEIFRLAIFKGESAHRAVQMAMTDPLLRRQKIKNDLEERLTHELDWYADDCHTDRRQRPIHTVKDLVDDDGFIVTPVCCEDYCRVTPRANLRTSSNRLRREVRTRGRFVHRGNDYLRVAVHNRFVMHVERSPDGLLEATSLTPPTKRRRSNRQRSGSSRRRAAA